SVVYLPPSSRRREISLRPAERCPRAVGGDIFAADPPRITLFFEEIEDKRIVDLAVVRLVTMRRIGDLHMADMRRRGAVMPRDIPMHALDVVDIELQAEVRVIDLLDQRRRHLKAIQEIARHIDRVDRLDQDRDTGRRAHVSGDSKVVAKRRILALPRDRFIAKPGHQMHPLRTDRPGVGEALRKAVTKFAAPPRKARKAAITLCEVAGAEIEQRGREAVGCKFPPDIFRIEFVGKEKFDALEAVFRSGREAIKEGQVLIEEAQIGGEFERHELLPVREPGGPARVDLLLMVY